MKIPALRAKIGDWTYYISSFTFEQVARLVKKIDNELHRSETLQDQIQRSITSNVKNIKNYILGQDERFFNSLVLAIYDGQPHWVEVEINYGEKEFYNMGFLELSGGEKIFPVDGQHRVEGIKAALIENEKLKSETVSVLFIGHKNTDDGMKKTRRLFTTLNRYSKPVKLNDIIALDEDDCVAIATRELLEGHPLFIGRNVNNAEQKAIPDADKTAFTSLITLYQCNLELYKKFIADHSGQNPTKLLIQEKLKYRPSEKDLAEFIGYVLEFWTTFCTSLDIIRQYLSLELDPARKFRNTTTGGNLLFRPVGILPFIQVVLDVNKRTGRPFVDILNSFNNIDLTISTRPWEKVVWNPIEKTMIMGNSALIKLLLLYLLDDELLSENELKKLKEKYASSLNIEDVDEALKEIK